MVEADSAEAIIESATELLNTIVEANEVEVGDIASVFFTTTSDLTAEFPALAARKMGWTQTALLCGNEMDVPGSLPMCLRVLLHVNTEKEADEIVHVYLGDAQSLRPEFQE